MRKKIYIGTGVFLLFIATTAENKALIVTSIVVLVLGALSLLAVKSGVEYSESHYRVYKRIFFWKTGHWKSILGVRRIYIRHYCYEKRNSIFRSRAIHEESTEEVIFQLYFVRKSGYYKIFESKSLETARRKAYELGRKYNLAVKERGDEKEKQHEIQLQVQPREELLAHG